MRLTFKRINAGGGVDQKGEQRFVLLSVVKKKVRKDEFSC